MSRIGARACESCNSASSDLEDRTKKAYLKIRDGQPLEPSDGVVLLDWLDKVRVGLWLWALDVGKGHYSFSPKFRIGTRLALKDRLVFLAKYRLAADMKGMAVWGFGESFLWSPSAIGFLINNIAVVSVSSDFLLLRHLRNARISVKISDSPFFEADVTPASQPGQRLNLLDSPYVIGQCILPAEMFPEFNITLERASTRYPNTGESPIFRLDWQMQMIGTDLGSVPIYAGDTNPHITLMELNLALAVRYLILDFLRSDFSRVSAQRDRTGMTELGNRFFAEENMEIEKLKQRYASQAHLRLLV